MPGEPRADEHDVPRLSRMERFGLRLLRLLERRRPRQAERPLDHVLDAVERARVEKICRATVLRAFAIGAGAAALIAGTQFLVDTTIAPGETWLETILHRQGPVLLMVVLATLAEIFLLHLDALRAVHDLSRVVGLPLFADDAAQRAEIRLAIARAALELPDPPERIAGCDPRLESSRLWLVCCAIAYKAKVGVSNFIAKALVRRLLGRAALRALLPFIAVPITGLWAAWVSARVMREARARVMGPSAVHELIDGLFATLGGTLKGPHAPVDYRLEPGQALPGDRPTEGWFSPKTGRRPGENAAAGREPQPRPWGAKAASRSDRWPRWGHRADAAQAQPRSKARSKRSWGAPKARGGSAPSEESATLGDGPDSRRDGEWIMRAVGSVVVRRGSMHPNLAQLLLELEARFGHSPPPTAYASRQLLAELPQVGQRRQALAMRAVGVAIAADGHLQGLERRFVRAAQRACGQTEDLRPFARLARAFTAGATIRPQLVQALWPTQTQRQAEAAGPA